VFARSGMVQVLGKRIHEIPQDYTSLLPLCEIVEIFSQGDIIVKKEMCKPNFIKDIFSKNFSTPNGTNQARFQLIMSTFNNISKEKSIVSSLWDALLVNKLVEYLSNTEDLNLKINDALNLCLSTLYNLVYYCFQDFQTKISQLILLILILISIIGLETPNLKVMAKYIFLEIILRHSKEIFAEPYIDKVNVTKVIIDLLEREINQNTVFDSLITVQNSNQIFEYLGPHIKKLSTILSMMLENENLEMKYKIILKVMMITEKCQKIAREFAVSNLFQSIILTVLSTEASNKSHVRLECFNLITLFYEVHPQPKDLIVKYQIDTLVKHFSNDPAVPVRAVANRLNKAITIHYII
jgi:hypothetical protein